VSRRLVYGVAVPDDASTAVVAKNATDTSRAAAAAIPGSATERTRAAIYRRIRDDADGATCDEIELEFGMPHQTASARLWELQGNGVLRGQQLIEDSGARRRTRRGTLAIVWRATDKRGN
jgi:hypothetical protein